MARSNDKSNDKKPNDHRPDDRQPNDPKPDEQALGEKKLDTQALTAAIAGFLACQVLTCRFLVQEGAIDGDKFIAFLEGALAEMSPGVDDPRALFGLQQLIHGLRTAGTPPERTQ